MELGGVVVCGGASKQQPGECCGSRLLIKSDFYQSNDSFTNTVHLEHEYDNNLEYLTLILHDPLHHQKNYAALSLGDLSKPWQIQNYCEQSTITATYFLKVKTLLPSHLL